MNEYFEQLVQNVQKGEMYFVKMKDSQDVFTGIPMIPGRYQNYNPIKFLFKIVSPEEKKGVYDFLLDEVEFMERTG